MMMVFEILTLQIPNFVILWKYRKMARYFDLMYVYLYFEQGDE